MLWLLAIWFVTGCLAEMWTISAMNRLMGRLWNADPPEWTRGDAILVLVGGMVAPASLLVCLLNAPSDELEARQWTQPIRKWLDRPLHT